MEAAEIGIVGLHGGEPASHEIAVSHRRSQGLRVAVNSNDGLHSRVGSEAAPPPPSVQSRTRSEPAAAR